MELLKVTLDLVGGHHIGVDLYYHTNSRAWNIILRLFSVGEMSMTKCGERVKSDQTYTRKRIQTAGR